jgi:dipeptidyl aminopeptidase/acylaminoacyl peptidase
MPEARFEQFFAVRRFSLLSNLSFSPDGDEVAYVHDGTGQMNLWRQPATGGWPTQLTVLEDDAARQHVWTPHGFVLGIDHHGNEQWQLNRLPASGGWPEDLTGRTDAQFTVGHLHPDGERLSFSGNGIRPVDVSVYLLHIPDGEIRTLIDEEGSHVAGPWHPDGRRMAVVQVRGNANHDISVFDIHSGERTALTPHEGSELNIPIGFSADGRHLYLITDRGHDFQWLGRLTLDGGREPEPVWRGDWDVEHAAMDRDRSRLAWVVNQDGSSSYHVRDLEAARDLPVPPLPAGWCLHLTLANDGRRLATTVGTATRPWDVYVADLEARTTTRLTNSFLGGVPEQDLIEPELVRYPTFDGRQVPAWLYRPRSAGPSPLLVSIHGGPEAQERPGATASFAFYQYLLSRGIGVLAPNIRGSTGYGRPYQRLIYRDWGGGDLRDIEATACYAQSLDWVDPKRLAVYGGSFGGFATLSAMTRLPQFWACGVDIVGPSNMLTFLKGIPPHWRRMSADLIGDPEADHDLLVERSPITHVDNIRAPLLVIQGAQDPRVVKTESDQMVERLRGLGREVEYHVFEDEGHGFTKRANQLHAYRLIGDFLFRHLGVGD